MKIKLFAVMQDPLFLLILFTFFSTQVHAELVGNQGFQRTGNTGFPLDKSGWSIIKPQVDSRLIYVSSSEGDDNRARPYFSAHIADPYNPDKKFVAYKSISKAMKSVRNGYPDWVLLKRGDEWIVKKPIAGVSGKAKSSPFVLTSYGDSYKRPLVKTGVSSGFVLARGRSFVAVVGVDFYAHQRDPNSIGFVGWDNVKKPSGFKSVTNNKADIQSLLLEDNVFRFYKNNVQINGNKKSLNIVIRRNQFLDSYSTTSHSQGVYIADGTLLLEENLFDHNGWFKQRFQKLNSRAEGQATFYNHNAYFKNINNSTIRGNIFSRASSMGVKFTSNSSKQTKRNAVKSSNLLIDGNLFIEGEIGLSIGGNTDFNNGYRWKNIRVNNNLMFNVGGSRPTNRGLAWHIDADDWDGGEIVNNYLLYNDNPSKVKNVFGIKVSGWSQNVQISRNVIHGLHEGVNRSIITPKNKDRLNIEVRNNLVNQVHIIRTNSKNIGSYMASLGATGGADSFIIGVKQQAKNNWKVEYTVATLYKYIKSSFVRDMDK